MDCAEEVSLLRKRFNRTAGVYELQLDVMQARMTIEFDPARITLEGIEDAVRELGLDCAPYRPESGPATGWRRHSRWWMVAASGVPLAAGMWMDAASRHAGFAGLLEHQSHGEPFALPVLACLLLAMAAGIAPSLAKSLVNLRHGRADMGLLVAISMAGAGFLGEWKEAATLGFLFALANALEHWSTVHVGKTVTGLYASLPMEHIHVGSLVRVKPGERIPCDGEVVSGESMVDQSIITGESVPVWKRAGTSVFAGALNGDGELEVRATKSAVDTTLARILRMVQGSGQRRSSAEQFVEKFTRYYTPAVFAAASLVAVAPPLVFGQDWERWFYQGMVVLLISCPCALVISTPVTMVSALASAARQGVLIKGGAALEVAARLKAIAFDPAILNGGNAAVAREVGRELKAVDVRSELMPEQKLEVLEELSRHGPVAMVGDGVNDAEAMAASSLGIALGSRSTDVASEAADVVIMAEDLQKLPFLIRHARRAASVIRQNVALSLGMKAVFLFLAFHGAASLWMALAADMGATLLVTFNGLRLLRPTR